MPHSLVNLELVPYGPPNVRPARIRHTAHSEGFDHDITAQPWPREQDLDVRTDVATPQ